MSEIPTADELVTRLRVILAEMGWADAPLFDFGDVRPDGLPSIYAGSSLPVAVWWAATELLLGSDHHSCWSCYIGSIGEACSMGACQNPGLPRWPDRELLKARVS